MLWQLGLNAVVAGAALALMAVGFGLIYRVVRFFHFAHGAVFTAGAYFTLISTVHLRLPLFFGVPLAVVLSALLGCTIELAVYRPLRRRRSSSLVLLLASLGVYLLLQNFVSLIFGDDMKTIRSGTVEEGVSVLGARITPIQILTVAVSLSLIVTLVSILKTSKMGKAMRAVANDSGLAGLSGIESNRVILWTFAIGSAFAGVAGILVALDVDMTPTMGMNALMMGVVAVIIGGVSSIPGIALGALLLAMAQHLGVWKISSQWQDAIAFVILLAFLLFRPQGFLGKKVKKATVQ